MTVNENTRDKKLKYNEKKGKHEASCNRNFSLSNTPFDNEASRVKKIRGEVELDMEGQR